MENKNRCMMCSYFKRIDKDLPDFGMCTKNDFEVVSSDLACGDFELKEPQKCCCGTYQFGNDEDKVLKYCANDVVIIAEQMAREKQKELEDKVEKYEKLLIDILNVTYKHPQLFEHNIHAYELIPGHIRFLRNSFDTMCDKYDPVFEENTKLKEEIERLKGSNNDLKEYYNDLLNNSFQTLKKEQEKITELIKASKRKDNLIRSLRNENKTRDDEIMRLQWRNDNQSRMIQDLKKERDELKNELDKYKESDDIYFTTTQVNAMVKSIKKENGEIKTLKDQIENLAKKNSELQIRVNDLLFQEKLNKSAFGYDYEEENSKLRVENERLRNQLKYYPTYSALKAEDKIEHLQKEAKRWKNKYKEAYDILETYFKHDLNGMEYDVSYDDINLKLRYSTPKGDKANKYNALISAYERLKKL